MLVVLRLHRRGERDRRLVVRDTGGRRLASRRNAVALAHSVEADSGKKAKADNCNHADYDRDGDDDCLGDDGSRLGVVGAGSGSCDSHSVVVGRRNLPLALNAEPSRNASAPLAVFSTFLCCATAFLTFSWPFGVFSSSSVSLRAVKFSDAGGRRNVGGHRVSWLIRSGSRGFGACQESLGGRRHGSVKPRRSSQGFPLPWSDVAGEWDLDNLLRPKQQRKEDYLELLQTGRKVMAALEFNLALLASRARRNGADFGEIGATQGISRQAARQAAKRSGAKRPVTLVGGPRDGAEAAMPRPGRLGSPSAEGPVLQAAPLDRGRRGAAIRGVPRKHGQPHVFEFAHYESHDGKVIPEPDLRPRIHHIAYAYGLDSRTVLAQAREVNPALRSPSSRVDRATLEQLDPIVMARRLGPSSRP